MAILNDILNKPLNEMTDEELEQQILMLKRMRLANPTKPKTKVVSNKEKQTQNLISNLNPKQLEILNNFIKQMEENK